MGFRVELSQNAESITRRLKASPYTLFSDAYAGYLFFLFDLVSEDDGPVTRWFQEHVEALDALTGSDVAFAIFAQNVHVRVQVPYQRQNGRSPDVVQVTLTDSDEEFDVQNLVTAGRCGWVADGDEIRAVNTAVYRLAKEFGLTHKLPCVVALDGIPDPRVPWKCFPLPEDRVRDLYPILRRAVGKLQISPNLPTYRSELTTLRDKTKERRGIESWAKECEAELVKKTPTPPPFSRWFSDVGLALRKGDRDLLSCRLRRFSELHDEPTFTSDFEQKYYATAASLLRSVRELSRILGEPWPLAHCDAEGLRTLYAETIRPLLSGEAEIADFDTRQKVVALYKEVRRLRASWLTTAMEEFPSPEQWSALAEAQRREPVIGRLDTWNRSLARIDLEIHKAAKSLLTSEDRPSWCKILEDEMSGLDRVLTGHDLSPSSRTEGTLYILDWAELPDSLSCLRKLDLLGLSGIFRNLISKFGEAVWKRCPTAFASYASADRAEVVRRVQGMRAFQPSLDIFLDFQSLNPGELWKNRLSQEIASRDRFFLFWSKAASQSEYVREEWRTALRLEKPITPVPVSSPSEVPPPKELAHLHFNDFYCEFLRCAQLPKVYTESG